MATRKWQNVMVHRTGNEHFTITEAHPYHKPVGKIDHKGAGNYTMTYDPHCPLCRQDEQQQGGHNP